mgnify:CR=1 FL=1
MTEQLARRGITQVAGALNGTSGRDHHGDGELGIWCPAPRGVQAELVETQPDRFYVPAYVGHRGWLGMRLDRDPDWDEVAGVLVEAYRTVAPKKLVAELDA